MHFFLYKKTDCFLPIAQYNNMHNIIDNIRIINTLIYREITTCSRK